MKRIKPFNILLLFTLAVQTPGAQETKFIHNLSSTQIELDYEIRNSVDNIGNQYIFFSGKHPTVLTFVNKDGSVSVCVPDEFKGITNIYEFSIDLVLQKKLSFKNELYMFGSFTKDEEGNYYFFYANYATKDEENMAMVKYDKDGEKINVFRLRANDNNFGGVKSPFYYATCRLELSGSMLFVYFARQRFDGHQSSYGFVINKDTFERVDKGWVYYNRNGTYQRGNNLVALTGHSLNQFILPINGGFVTASHGDAYPRAFAFAKFQDGVNTVRLDAYKFRGSMGENATYAEMGGLAKTSTGYIFLGTCGKGNINNPRNLFIITFDDELLKCSLPLYITNYTKDNGHAGHSKIVEIEPDRYLVLWEMFKFSTQSANLIIEVETDYKSTYIAIIDKTGALLSEIQELKNIRLNMNDVLRFNPVNKKVYWAVNEGANSIRVYALDTAN